MIEQRYIIKVEKSGGVFITFALNVLTRLALPFFFDFRLKRCDWDYFGWHKEPESRRVMINHGQLVRSFVADYQFFPKIGYWLIERNVL